MPPPEERHISRRDFLGLGATALAAGGAGALGGTEFLRRFVLNSPEQSGPVDRSVVSAQVATVSLPIVNFFLDGGGIINTELTQPDAAPLNRVPIQYFINTKYVNNVEPGIQVAGGYNNQTIYTLSFGLPEAAYDKIMKEKVEDRNMQISKNLIALSVSIVGKHGLQLSNGLLFGEGNWIDASSRYRRQKIPTTDQDKVSQDPHRYRSFDSTVLNSFVSDVYKVLSVF